MGLYNEQVQSLKKDASVENIAKVSLALTMLLAKFVIARHAVRVNAKAETAAYKSRWALSDRMTPYKTSRMDDYETTCAAWFRLKRHLKSTIGLITALRAQLARATIAAERATPKVLN